MPSSDADTDDVELCPWDLCDGSGVYCEEIYFTDPDSHMPQLDDIIEKECPCKTELP